MAIPEAGDLPGWEEEPTCLLSTGWARRAPLSPGSLRDGLAPTETLPSAKSNGYSLWRP